MQQEIIDKITTLMATAFGLVAALAWNNTIKLIFLKVFGEKNTIISMLIYAIVVTIIAVIATIWLTKALQTIAQFDLKEAYNISMKESNKLRKELNKRFLEKKK